ncbi:hypothetical protein [uncultured Fibrobacter sp.]|uniref:hypothetical protein n=1 Tax=uncultured Fibrobacter sp. TaxID=261512 RepID=UPI0026340D23|nr:hypothetical protein [uncultured Fibrobacter sp.]
MRFFHKTSALSFYLIHSGFKAFKDRVKEELAATGGGNLDDLMDDDSLHAYYRNGDSPDYVAATLWNPVMEED